MKKIYSILILATTISLNIYAQPSIGTSILHKDLMGKTRFEAGKMIEGTIIKTTDAILNGKTTVGGNRWYSYTDYCALLDAAFVNNGSYPYMWDKYDALAIYSDTTASIFLDTVYLTSYGTVFDPAFKSTKTTTGIDLGGFNEPTVYPKGSIVIQRTDDYSIDSVIVYGYYGRNNTRTTSVDTLRLSLVYGNGGTSDLGLYTSSGSSFIQPYHDTSGKNILRSYAISPSSLKVVDILLRKTDTGIKGFGAAIPSFKVPAGNVVAVAVTFKSGDTYTPYVDTIFYGPTRPSNPFGRGLFRPSFYEQFAGGFPLYYADYYNMGFTKTNPYDPSWRGLYVPAFARTAPFILEIPDIEVKVSCTTCNTIQGLAVTDAAILDKVGAYPNPSNTELNVPFTLLEKANVTVSLSNLVGQVIAIENMGSLNAGQKATATFNTSNLAAGIYLYTVEANGQRMTNRFTVAH